MVDKKIIMNFTVPPSLDDMEVMAAEILEQLPEELSEHSEGLSIAIEDFPEDSIQTELDLDDPFELLALYKSGKELSPGVTRKVSNDEDILTLYRRPILDLWCETGDDVSSVIREAVIEELGRVFEFSDDDVADMAERHYQGLL